MKPKPQFIIGSSINGSAQTNGSLDKWQNNGQEPKQIMNSGAKNIQYEASSASSFSPISQNNNDQSRLSKLG